MTRDGNYRSKKLAPPLSRQTSNFRDSSFKLHVFLLLQRFSQPAFRINAGEREKGKKKKKERRGRKKSSYKSCYTPVNPNNLLSKREMKNGKSKSTILERGTIRKVRDSIAFEILKILEILKRTGVLKRAKKGDCNLREEASL